LSAAKRRTETSRKRQKTIATTDKAIAAASAPEPTPEPSFLERCFTTKDGRRHERALAFLTSANRYRIACAGRQSAKTWSVFCAMIDVALRKEYAQGLYLSFSKAAAERTTWPTLKRILRAYNIDATIVETKQRLDFPNGSQLYFLGSASKDYVETFRGTTLDIAVVDEAGSTPSSRLRPLVDGVLAHCLRVSRGPLLVIGTPPRKRIGWFADQWFKPNSWTKIQWNGSHNPFVPDFDEYVAEECGRLGVTIDDPQIQRELFAEWIEDSSRAVLPNFSAEQNTFVPDESTVARFDDGFAIRAVQRQPLGLPDGTWYYSMGVDPGSRDRLAVQVSAWCDASPNLYQVAEFVAKRDANHPLSVLVDHIRRFFALYGVMPVYVDTSGKDLINTLQKDHHIHSVQAARKVDREGQIVRVNSLCSQRRLQIVRGSALAVDCQLTEWDERKAHVEGPRRYTDSHHPDGLDAFRYSLGVEYWNLAKPEDKRSNDEKVADLRKTHIQELLEASRRRANPTSIVDFTSDVAPW
jgi:hypothetical protein